jgi:hypothetical protein
MIAMQELVVPKSMPKIFAIYISSAGCGPRILKLRKHLNSRELHKD